MNAEDIKIEKIRTLDLPWEIYNITSKTASQNLSSETHDPNHEAVYTNK